MLRKGTRRHRDRAPLFSRSATIHPDGSPGFSHPVRGSTPSHFLTSRVATPRKKKQDKPARLARNPRIVGLPSTSTRGSVTPPPSATSHLGDVGR